MPRSFALFIALAAISPAPADEPALRGVVRFDGQPAAGAKLWLLGPVGATLATATAGDDGRFAVPLAADAQPYTLFARDAKRRVGWANVSRLDDADQQTGVRVDLNDVTDARGKLTDTTGKPFAGVRLKHITINIPNADERRRDQVVVPRELTGEYEADTVADGTFTLLGVPKGGSTFLEWDVPGYGRQRARFGAGATTERKLEPAGMVRLIF